MNKRKAQLNLEQINAETTNEQPADLIQKDEEIVPLPTTPPSPTDEEDAQRLTNMINPLESRTAKPMESASDRKNSNGESSPGELISMPEENDY